MPFIRPFTTIQIGIAFAFVDSNICVHLHLYPFIRSITLFRAANNNDSLFDFVFHFMIFCCSSSYFISISVNSDTIFYGSIFHWNKQYKHEPLPEALEIERIRIDVRICYVCTRWCGGEKKKNISFRWKHNQAQTIIVITIWNFWAPFISKSKSIVNFQWCNHFSLFSLSAELKCFQCVYNCLTISRFLLIIAKENKNEKSRLCYKWLEWLSNGFSQF